MADWSRGLLGCLDEDERRRVLATATRRRFSKGETLFHEGDPGDTLHLIDKGYVAIRISTPLGDVATLCVLGSGEAFGEQALYGPGGHRTASAVALDAVETRALHRGDFDELVKRSPQVQGVLIEVLAAQVRRLSSQLSEALYVPADTRVFRRVADLVKLFGRSEGPVTLPVTQDDVASMAGTTRPTANRALKSAEADGVLALGRGRIEILDRAALARLAR